MARDAEGLDDEVIRILSTRKADRDETRQYGIPYQNLINLYLRECAESAKTLAMKWG